MFRRTGTETTKRPRPNDKRRDRGYEARKERERQRQAEMSRTGRDIGDLPPIADPARREAAEASFKAFCESYGRKKRFTKGWSSNHLVAIEKIERAVRDGGLFALAMPRASGKTTLADFAVLWATLCGYHAYVVMLGASQTHGKKRLAAIKRELQGNTELAADFPELLAIHKLQGIAQRAKGQTYHGTPTEITWSTTQVCLPTIEHEAVKSSGAVIECGGLLQAVRGLNFVKPDGSVIRPTFVIPDDPQTRRSARSASQTAEREAVLNGDLLYLAGPGEKISAVMPCTVIEPDDMAARLLDRERNPEWQGERTRLMDAMPTNMDWWDEYADRRRNEIADGGSGAKATAFYKRNRKKADAGAKPTWPERFNKDEISAVQHAMNLYYRDRASFMAEMQNDPEEAIGDNEFLDAAAISRKISGYDRGEIPPAASHVTGFIDVQKDVLFWLTAAWADDFTGWVLDYGAWPDQRLSYFTLRGIRRTLAKQFPGARLQGRLRQGLDALLAELLGTTYQRADGAAMQIDTMMVDANWGESTDVVYEAVRPHNNVFPSHGRGVKASDRPMHEWTKQKGERRGDHAFVRTAKDRKARYVLYDVNHWKTFLHRGLATTRGDRGSICLFDGPPSRHKMIADHLAAEVGIPVTGRGRTVYEWRIKPGAPDNHLFDCAVGAAVAASLRGVKLTEHRTNTPPPAPNNPPPQKSSGVWYPGDP